jgi:hypothetical protein
LSFKLIQWSNDKVCHINLFRFCPFELPLVYDAELISEISEETNSAASINVCPVTYEATSDARQAKTAAANVLLPYSGVKISGF